MTATTLNGFLYIVDSLHPVGIAPPREFDELRRRYETLQASQNGHFMRDRLITAVLSGGGDIPQLWAASLAETYPSHPDVVLGDVANHIYPEFLRIWAPVARKNYGIVADKFDQVAKQFTDCAATVDVEAGADLIVDTADRKAQQAWRDALGLSKQLDELLFPLMCAAALTGAEGDPGNPTFDQPTLAIPLTVNNIDRLHRRHAWNRWHLRADGWPPLAPLTKQAVEAAMHAPAAPPAPRCGKWSGLAALGATLQAHTKPSDLKLFAPPAAHFVEWVRNPRGSYDCVRRDPEDTGQPIKVGASPSIAGVAE
jgi:hypothetical protein